MALNSHERVRVEWIAFYCIEGKGHTTLIAQYFSDTYSHNSTFIDPACRLKPVVFVGRDALSRFRLFSVVSSRVCVSATIIWRDANGEVWSKKKEAAREKMWHLTRNSESVNKQAGVGLA